jgi:tRNA(Ile)-lysidine synthase
MEKDIKRAIELINIVNTKLQSKCFFTSQKSVLLSFSAGQDSICMLFIIKHLAKQWRSMYGIFLCNHLWQTDSFYTVLHTVKISFLTGKSLSFVLASHKLRSEEMSRYWRHNSLQRVSLFYHYNTIATGHTSSDRVETVVSNIIRGTGRRGLCSLTWNKFIQTCDSKQHDIANFAETCFFHKSYFFRLGK